MTLNKAAHGRFEITVRGQVLILKALEQWNEEAALAFEQEWMRLATPIANAPWAHLVFLDDWELSTPEVAPIISRVVVWSVAHNMTHAAQVYSPNMLKKYEPDRMVDNSKLPFEKQVFLNENDAIQWLNGAGFYLDR